MSGSDHLTQIEATLLSILQRDASAGAAEMAEAAGASPATVWRRIRALEERGVIGPPVRLVDPARVGRGTDVFCQVRMKSQDAAARAAFQRAVDAEPAILEAYSMTGDWDYLLHMVVRDIADFEGILMRGLLELDCVAGTSTLFALRRIKHSSVVPPGVPASD
ncbi:Lrp/AsnC family transcriptional regulator [Rhodovulum sp. DZ06]|uniref:Lrp/AsnC family transcriptional regulator n=1 Tax=Rhodovulum sp. DZ06 TaxID=3425126 RepID=UPI003D328AF9